MKITIAGAGISGLLNAYYLTRAGHEVEIFERASRPGGLIETLATPDGPMDYAASTLINSSPLEELFQDIGLSVADKGKRAHVKNIYRGKFRRWPLGAGETARMLAGISTLALSKNRGIFAGQTVSQWGKRRLGGAAYRYLLETFLQGVYAGDGDRMSASLILGAAFARRPKTKKPKARGAIMPVGGMESLPLQLAAFLQDNGVKIHYRQTIRACDLPLEHPVLLALPAPAAGRILADLGNEAGHALARLEMLSLVNVHLVFDDPQPLFEGFGALFPVSQGLNTLGVLAGRNGFPNEYPRHTERWIIGGAHAPEHIEKSDQSLIELALADRQRLSAGTARPAAAHVLRRPRSLPHYTVELENILKSLRLPKNLFLAGNYLGGIGLGAILRQSQQFAASLARHRQP